MLTAEGIKKTMSDIFTGKGGTTRFAIAAIVMLTVLDGFFGNKYELSGGNSNGSTFCLKPSREYEGDQVEGEGVNTDEPRECSGVDGVDS